MTWRESFDRVQEALTSGERRGGREALAELLSHLERLDRIESAALAFNNAREGEEDERLDALFATLRTLLRKWEASQ